MATFDYDVVKSARVSAEALPPFAPFSSRCRS